MLPVENFQATLFLTRKKQIGVVLAGFLRGSAGRAGAEAPAASPVTPRYGADSAGLPFL